MLVPKNSEYQNAAGSIAHDIGEYDKAIKYYEQALTITLEPLGAEHPRTTIIKQNLEQALQKTKR